MLAFATHRGSRRFLPPLAAAWLSSGILFAQNLFGALSVTRSGARPPPEHPVASALAGEAGIVLGVLMGLVILLALHDRRRAWAAAR